MFASEDESRQHVLSGAARLADRSVDDPELLLSRYYRHVPTDDLLEQRPEDLVGAALSHRSLAAHRAPGTARVRVFTPSVEQEGWATGHTVVEIVTDDMPFLVDSITAELARQDRSVHLLVHPQFVVRRDADGTLLEITGDDVRVVRSGGADGSADRPPVAESWMHLQIDRESDAPDIDALRVRLEGILEDVRAAVEDWSAMRSRAQEISAGLGQEPPVGVDEREVGQARSLLDWLASDQFTFLGYREYVLAEGGADVLEAVAGTGLGLLRDDRAKSDSSTPLPPSVAKKAREKRLYMVTKANSRATVHRAVYLDYVGIKTFDEAGEVVGERRFIGLFTSAAYTSSVTQVPFVAHKVQEIAARAGFAPDSHLAKDLLGVVETYPRDELFQADVDHLTRTALAVVHLNERRRTKLFLRRDDYGRFMSCIVYLPRDRYNTAVRLRMQAILSEAFNGSNVDYTTRVSESSLARLHFVVRVPSGASIPDADVSALEGRLVEATRTWDEEFAEAARVEHGEERTAALLSAYGRAFPAAFKEDFHARVAVADLRLVESLSQERGHALNVYHQPGAPEGERRLKLYRRGPVSLSAILPFFTDLGVEVTDERPYAITRSDGQVFHIYDIGLRADSEDVWSRGSHDMRSAFQEAFDAVWGGRAESDGFNALVLSAGLTWRDVVVLRTVAKYLRQAGITFSQDYIEATLRSNPDLARLLVDLFATRFDPDAHADDETGRRACRERQDDIVARLRRGLDEVSSLDEDRIIRAFGDVLLATLRTNYYQHGPDGEPKATVCLKLDPTAIPGLPDPRPMFEIWVYGPRVEGVHLRFGAVARGGLRWSDRREDFRTEVLGLVKAQMVKNAVIVPTGSKGGFYAKALPDPADREAWLAEGIEAYKLFISSLLDVTDNRSGGEIVGPDRVVRHDAEDPYLVVAADKGTATFSDIANGVARDYGFWLDDAFASGGSAGYDHKGMGITARGAWESVKRHFRELGHDTQEQDFTVVGVGDMSGDVFGNGMLCSEHIRLVAAFDHRHVFVDPDPDAASTFAERRRLFELPRSSWADYDTSLISEGGGVFSRQAKSIPVSPQMREALGLAEGVDTITPNDLMKAVLLAPVDLLWNGGIGTYIKSKAESHEQIGDRANEAIRVDGADLRVRVVGEGGNLGASQLGRIEAALAGVRINTDAIDNSAGVDTSDHEVNIKILLTGLMRADDLTLKQRNETLASMTDDVGAAVLRDNYEQNVLLGNARAQENAMLGVHERFIHWLEERGDLDRELEFLPDDATIAARGEQNRGLTSPEFSVLVAYAKLALKHDLMAGDLPDEPWFASTLAEYFPAAIRERFADHLAEHPLRREIIVNSVANSVVNRGGITFVFRTMEETGAGSEQVARAFVVAREVFDLRSFVEAVEALDNVVPTAVQTRLYLEFRRLLDRAVRWFLQNRPAQLDVAAEIERFASAAAWLRDRVGDLLCGAEAQRMRRDAAAYVDDGVPEALAERAAALLDTYSCLDMVEIAAETGHAIEDVAPVYFAASESFEIDSLLFRVGGLPREDRWDALARGAMRDDLYAVLDSLTRTILDATDAQDSAQDRLRTWMEDNSASLERTRNAMLGIDRIDRPGLAPLSVALRSLRSIVRAGSATT
ncbi:NAD-glutamate dehydrogenase [Agilicoccus flavus]|uniref:NAD-glutamate dehydrogenase n=1 Tax=Agilicoccus flavus TaxID=2775968 RepID=UPI001CF63CA9|nr:NAD-glutamate dehydrogenase [Agilicoccus flavus]